MIRLLPGDCREVLATLPANSVHCVCTSPPYYALRSYLPDGHADKHREIGSEPTPDAYLAEMVGVFREVRRVLRPDGTCWVNMGSSYASGTTKGRGVSGGKRANQSLSCERVPAYGSDGTAPEDYRDPDYAYSGPDDGLSNGSLNHHDHTADNDQPQQQSWRHSENVAAHGSEQRVAFDKPMPQPDARVSTSLASSGSAQDACGLGGPALAALSGDQTLPGAELQSDGSSAFPSALHSYSDVLSDQPSRTHDSVEIGGSSASRTTGRGAGSVSCNCGSCGICFAYLATPMLQFKATDLMMMPALFALALQADGWFVRSDIIWAKPNPMPESVNSRPTSAHEHVFLLTKRSRYYYDADAVREEPSPTSHAWLPAAIAPATDKYSAVGNGHDGKRNAPNPAGRNCRNVWTIATAPFSQSHFATMPPAVVERCIRAGTSERGCCAACGAPWGRVVERSVAFTSGSGKTGNVPNGKHAGTVQALSGEYDIRMGPSVATTTTGWAPSCACAADVVPAVVLDPFGGAGTTALVADRLQRDAILIELNPDYTRMAMDRCRDDAPLFAEPSPPPAEAPEEQRIRDLFAEPLAAD